MNNWLTSLRDRPIAEHERRVTMTLTVAVLSITTLLLALTQPPKPHPHNTHNKSPGTLASKPPQRTPNTRTPAPLTPVLEQTATRFLAGYLNYLYGRAPASHIENATVSLIRSLNAQPLRISPSMRGRRARVVALHPTPAPVGLVGVSALVNDGGLVNYPIVLLLTVRDSRLLVSGIDGA